MTRTLPEGETVPEDGSLPCDATQGFGDTPFGVYVHVPFCRVRCGYCDFNTYTSDELRGARRDDYADQAIAALGQAERVLSATGLPSRDVSTVFFGGGTPTMLPAADLARMLDRIRLTWGLAA